MADGHGGYRAPAHPAAVSPPGALSKRTDGHPSQIKSAAPGQDYGSATQQMQQQSVAPLAGAAPLPAAAQAPQGQPDVHQMPAFNGPSLSDPTQRPNEPITTGSAIGPGAGPEALTMQPQQGMGPATGAMTQMLSQIAPTDASGVVAALLAKAQSLGV